MDEPVSDEIARGRWMVMTVVRLSGVAMVVIALLVIRGTIALPEVAGYVLLGVGLVDIFVVPQVLARKWRSPRE